MNAPISLSLRTRVAYPIVLVAIVWLLALIGSYVIRWIATPDIDNNAKAYAKLAQTALCVRYSEKQALAEEALSLATDPEIRSVADILVRSARVSIGAGSETPEEANSFGGLGQAFLTGFLNPMKAIEGAGLSLDVLFGNWDAAEASLDSKYKPVFKSYNRAALIGTVCFWLLLVGGVVVAIRYKLQIRNRLLPAIQRVHWLS